MVNYSFYNNPALLSNNLPLLRNNRALLKKIHNYLFVSKGLPIFATPSGKTKADILGSAYALFPESESGQFATQERLMHEKTRAKKKERITLHFDCIM